MKHFLQHLVVFSMAFSASVIVLSQPAVAQDAAAMAAQQAAQQANQQAMQAAQQANQQAMDDAQRASQQAMQDGMNASQNAGGPMIPPRRRPTVPVTPKGPVPQQIAAAHTVFLSNLGSAPNAPADMNDAYEQFSQALAAWGHYTLVDTPGQANLIFELREIAPLTDVSGYRGDVASYATPAFELHIRDEKTGVVLWTVISPIEDFGKRSERSHWYELAISNLVSRVKVVTATPLNPQEIVDLTAMPTTHDARNVLILTGVAVGAAATAGILLHHAFENSVANQQQQQDSFCLAHGIPLSECAGG
ncbi:hypothetical protein SAMN05421819_3350 [Bryocella elongata]|uniref:Uncharacterized protein n=1 Tax=Bryocella elongata TaxID=863522 RepID=A0A1H6AZV7_9BACT|nr:hypothetical protein [Bryocella elongata]SEG53346.1 hypothetical protein SAMN05421819_3350 [Bryocella elongata]